MTFSGVTLCVKDFFLTHYWSTFQILGSPADTYASWLSPPVQTVTCAVPSQGQCSFIHTRRYNLGGLGSWLGQHGKPCQFPVKYMPKRQRATWKPCVLCVSQVMSKTTSRVLAPCFLFCELFLLKIIIMHKVCLSRRLYGIIAT